ncbi:MAG: hypothetical protein PVI06_14685 [Desulfobacterales bacterium]
MISAILMAGYNNKRAVKKYAKIVAEHYGQEFIETGYKPLREFKTLVNGKKVRKPLIQFTLEKLFHMDTIADIVIVGHRMLLERRLAKFIAKFKKPCKIINQNTHFSKEIVRRFNILPRKVKFNSIAGNMIKGYAASASSRKKTHALYVASDSPLTTRAFIEKFVQLAEDYRKDSAIIFPAVLMETVSDKLGRSSLRLINDTEHQLSDLKDNYGRQGFRLSSVMMADPHRFDINTANTAYNLRKALNPNVQLRLFRITRSLGYANVYSKYFFKKDLSIREVENITSAFFNGKFSIIPMKGENSTYDYDGTEYEFRFLSDMLKHSPD